MNPNFLQNNPMMMPFNFNQNLYGMRNFNPMWNMNPFWQMAQKAQFEILKQNINLPNIQGGNSKPKSEPITIIFKKKNTQNIYTIETSLDESMASVVSKYIEISGDNNVNRFYNHGKKITEILTIKENGLKNNNIIEVVRLKQSELEAL